MWEMTTCAAGYKYPDTSQWPCHRHHDPRPAAARPRPRRGGRRQAEQLSRGQGEGGAVPPLDPGHQEAQWQGGAQGRRALLV